MTPRLPGFSVGLGLFTGQGAPGRATTIDQLPALAHAAEDAGFDAFWVSEHHGFPDAYLPSPLVALASAASVTERILLGTGIALAPLHHPVRLAEDAAVVDVLSGGRLLLGLGLGYATHEFEMFGVDRRDRGRRLDELLTFLRRAWAGEPVVPPGGSSAVRVTPTPTEGTIPIWLGGYAEPALDRVARTADGYLLGRGDPDVLAATSAHLLARDPTGALTYGCNLITLLDHPEDPADAVLHDLRRHQQQYRFVQERDDPYDGRAAPVAEELTLADAARSVHVRGDADAVVAQIVEQLAPLARWQHVHVVIRALFPTSDLARLQRRVATFGRDVLPRLRATWDQDPGRPTPTDPTPTDPTPMEERP